MAHLRLRKFNTRDAYPDQQLDNDLAMAVRAGSTVYLRGQTAMDLAGKLVGIGDAAAQAEKRGWIVDQWQSERKRGGGGAIPALERDFRHARRVVNLPWVKE